MEPGDYEPSTVLYRKKQPGLTESLRALDKDPHGREQAEKDGRGALGANRPTGIKSNRTLVCALA